MKSLLISLIFLFSTASAHAGEGFFARTYTTDTTPAHHFELEQLVRNRTGRAFGSYSAFDFKSEFEYGITDDFQAALYLNFGAMNAKGAPDDDDPNGATGFSRNMLFFQGISTEFVYRVLSPYSDPIGLAFYMEPEVSFHDLHNGLEYDWTIANEYKIIVQKNFFDDQLILALNTSAEIEFIRFKGDQEWQSELDWNNDFGATYRFIPNWYAGLELHNHNELGNFVTHEHSVLWIGPSLHYGGSKMWGTLSAMKQVYGSPNGTDENGTFIGDSLFLRSHENWEFTAKVGFPF